jgi:hypothetical protein
MLTPKGYQSDSYHLQPAPSCAGFSRYKMLCTNTVSVMLTYLDLKTIQEGNRRNRGVMELLREVQRLRDLVVLTYSLLAYIPVSGLSGEDRECLRPNALNDEPVVGEYRKMRAEREEMEFRGKEAMETRDVRTCEAGR